MNRELVSRKNDLIYRLRSLPMAGTVLHLGAHPDDEDIGLLSYITGKYGARAIYWSATRGEGGQNRIGPYKEEQLGVYRTWEAQDARAIDGGECLYGPFFDFGYSKTADESFYKWGHDEVVKQIVRAIRMAQPQILVARWRGDPGDFHGHHQAIGTAVYEAYEASGDPEQFPELEDEGLYAWQPQKCYQSMNNSGGDLRNGGALNLTGTCNPDYERDGILRINTGEFDPISGTSYQEEAWAAYCKHQTQSMGVISKPGDFYYYFALYKSQVEVPARETSIYNGLDPTLTGLADYPGRGARRLRNDLEQIKTRCAEALQCFRVESPVDAGKKILEGLALLKALRVNLAGADLESRAEQAISVYLTRKIADFEAVAARCLRLRLECLTDDARITPGQRFQLTSTLWNFLQREVSSVGFTVLVPERWEIKLVDEASAALHSTYEVTAAPSAALSTPYWLSKPKVGEQYIWPKGAPAGLPFGPPPVQVDCQVQLGGDQLTLRAPAILREKFPGGQRELTMAVIPPISLSPHKDREFLVVGPEDQRVNLMVTARSNMEHEGVEGSLRLDVPDGWHVEPAEIELALGPLGDSTSAYFSVRIPRATPAGHYTLRYVVRVCDRDYDVVLHPIHMGMPGLPGLPDETNCVREEFVITPSMVEVCMIDVRFAKGLKCAYIRGAPESIPEVLEAFDLHVRLITDQELAFIELAQFDVIVVGPNAYLTRAELRKNYARFLDYVAHGGTLVVQYQGYGYQGLGFAPYPFAYNQPHDRVSYEDAPVTFLEPEHPVLTWPNRISHADFEHWIVEQGLYYFSSFDKRYLPIIEANDPGEAPKKGGLLVAGYGQGAYVYTGLSFFRQIPAGVTGAIRLFANLVSLPAARIHERATFLKRVALFAPLADEDLHEVANLMSEHWMEDGAYICRIGDPADKMYTVVKGDVEILRKVAGKEELYYQEGEGDTLGEMSFFAETPHEVAIRAKGPVQLLVIEAEQLRVLLQQKPMLVGQIIKVLANELRKITGWEKR
ncbi:MAG TPA: cyclic nucleotide-binding domain-containing protein [Methanomicrobia archaeon]|nr:cyclic nucleotide-binding domain-containing protein [Methanomicrobia archaeon]